jgi:integrase/recombinase XerD
MLRDYSEMKSLAEMYSFSSKLWFDKRWLSKAGDASLYLQVVINGKHKEFPLKLKWPADKIDLANGTLVRRRKEDPDLNDYNLLIMAEIAKHAAIFKTYRLKEIALDITRFAHELNYYDPKGCVAVYMEQKALLLKDSKEISFRTWQNTEAVRRVMLEFNPVWPFKMVNGEWMAKFKRFMKSRQYRPGIYHKPGHVWTVIKTVKAYLQMAAKDPMKTVDMSAANFSNQEPDWETRYLNKSDVNKLLAMVGNQLTVNQNRILKAFLFQCFTSMRISDVYRANSFWKVSDGFLSFVPWKNRKNGRWLHIPIMPMAKDLIADDTGKFFDLPNEGEFNLVLKDLARLAGINKRLTSHVGRHTFGYLYMTTVGNLKGLQEILGHKDIKTTMRYAHLDDEYKTESVQRIQDRFSDALLKVV